MAAERARLHGLYAITPDEPDTNRLVGLVGASLAGGAAAIQYRAKAVPPARGREQATALLALCRSRGVPFLVNDSLELARAIGADGVHLGREDGDARAARAAMPGGLVGISCYDELERVRAAAASGADYVAIGSVFASATKPHARRASLGLIAEAKRVSGLPVVAIGGITAANAREAVDAGADMVAVISAVFDAPDVAGAARAIAQAFGDERSPRNVRAQPRAL